MVVSCWLLVRLHFLQSEGLVANIINPKCLIVLFHMNDTTKKILVFAEIEKGRVADVSLELIGKANELARHFEDSTVGACLIGQGIGNLSDHLFSYGCSEVYLAEGDELASYRTLPFTKAMTDIISDQNPEIVLFGATPTGRDLAPRVASRLQVGLTADCTDLQIGPHRDAVKDKTYEKVLYQIRPAFGGNIIATIVSPETRPQMATVRPGVMHKAEPDEKNEGVLKKVDIAIPEEALGLEVLEHSTSEHRVDLGGAGIIVAGGAGVGSRENFKLIRRLAEVLGGEVGASRAAVDGGLVDKPHQVGQTGTTVRPKLYIACGISGAVQHKVGMQDSGKIIAINTDPEAPIFDVAHYGIVGDLNQVVPKLIDAYKKNTR